MGAHAQNGCARALTPGRRARHMRARPRQPQPLNPPQRAQYTWESTASHAARNCVVAAALMSRGADARLRKNASAAADTAAASGSCGLGPGSPGVRSGSEGGVSSAWRQQRQSAAVGATPCARAGPGRPWPSRGCRARALTRQQHGAQPVERVHLDGVAHGAADRGRVACGGDRRGARGSRGVGLARPQRSRSRQLSRCGRRDAHPRADAPLTDM